MCTFRMHSTVTVSGILCLLLASGLGVVGHHDGVLVEPAPDPLPVDGTPVAVTLRATVLQAPISGAEVRNQLAGDGHHILTLPRALDDALAAGRTYVPVQAEGVATDGLPVLAHVPADRSLAPGDVVVLEGQMTAHAVLVESDDGALRVTSLVLFSSDEARTPLVFV